MELSVVVVTLNDRERLCRCLDALAARLPRNVEIVVVNGPSSDGTTGTVRERPEVDVLVEIAERSHGVARNAGIEHASGGTIAFVGDSYRIADSWHGAVRAAVDAGAEIVTGPGAGASGDDRSVDGRRVTPFAGPNVAFDRRTLESLDGFDEYLSVDDAADCAHRAAALGHTVTWSPEMAVRPVREADGGRPMADLDGPADRYRELAYRLGKNYGPRPHVLARPLGSAIRDGVANARAVLGGEQKPTGWFADGRRVAVATVLGLRDGLRARYADRSPRRNPDGLSARRDRAVRVYDQR